MSGITGNNPLNKIYPMLAGGEVTVPASGSLVVDTGMRDCEVAHASLNQDSVATAAGVSVSRVARTPNDIFTKLLIKTWAADGSTAGSTAAKVNWVAFGK